MKYYSGRYAKQAAFRRKLFYAHPAGNDHLLDLRGTLVDLGDLGVAHEVIERILAGVAVAAHTPTSTTEKFTVGSA